MSQSSATPTDPPGRGSLDPPGRDRPVGAFFGLLATLVLFFISADQGAVSIPAGNAIHEWVHDGRHLLGYPCH